MSIISPDFEAVRTLTKLVSIYIAFYNQRWDKDIPRLTLSGQSITFLVSVFRVASLKS